MREELELVGPRIEEIRSQLSQPPGPVVLDLADDITAAELEDRLETERAQLEIRTSALRDAELLAGESSNSRKELSRRLADLGEDSSRLNEELLQAAREDVHPDLTQAARHSARAHRWATLAEIEQIRAHLDLLKAQDGLIPWMRDKAQRDVDDQTERILLLARQSGVVRRRESRETAGGCAEPERVSSWH